LVKKRIRKKNKELGDKDWWEVYKEKKMVKKLYWIWRKGKIERGDQYGCEEGI